MIENKSGWGGVVALTLALPVHCTALDSQALKELEPPKPSDMAVSYLKDMQQTLIGTQELIKACRTLIAQIEG